MFVAHYEAQVPLVVHRKGYNVTDESISVRAPVFPSFEGTSNLSSWTFQLPLMEASVPPSLPPHLSGMLNTRQDWATGQHFP